MVSLCIDQASHVLYTGTPHFQEIVCLILWYSLCASPKGCGQGLRFISSCNKCSKHTDLMYNLFVCTLARNALILHMVRLILLTMQRQFPEKAQQCYVPLPRRQAHMLLGGQSLKEILMVNYSIHHCPMDQLETCWGNTERYKGYSLLVSFYFFMQNQPFIL